MIEIRLLGTIEAVGPDGPVRLGGARAKALLAMLALHANEPVSAERLMDDLWGEDVPATGATALHNQVRRLRQALGTELIVTRGRTYVLEIEPEQLDVLRFQAAVDAARAGPPSESAGLLREALELWRGEPLAGAEPTPVVVAEAARLEDARVVAVESRVDADLALGRHKDLVGELSSLAVQFPLRERFREQLMVALYRSGRQAEALDVYRETRRLLADELGLEPGPRLRELEQAVLRHDPALAGPVTTPPRAPEQPGGDPGRHRGGHARALLVAAGLAAVGLAGGLVAVVLQGSSDAPTRIAAGASAVPVGAVASTAGPVSTAGPASTATAEEASSAGTTSKATVTAASPATRPAPASTSRSTTTVAPPPATPASPRPVTSQQPVPVATTGSSAAPVATSGGSGSRPRVRPTPAKAPAVGTGPAVGTTTSPATGPVKIGEDFESTGLDVARWYTIHEGTGAEIEQSGGRLEFRFAPDAKPGGQWLQVGGHLGTRCRFPGDFDARIRFILSAWPPANGVSVLLWAFVGPDNAGAQVGRGSGLERGEHYTAWIPPDAGSLRLASDSGGLLRLARTDGTLTASIWNGSRWEALASRKITGSAVIAPGATAGVSFAGQAVVVAFDDFEVVGANPECPGG